ncbi:MAG: threonine-phosphate decarboxylase CobD [Xanthobacteraceae bacterium]
MAQSVANQSAAGKPAQGIYHGGNLHAAREMFPHAPAPWIDLSTGINPVPYPIGSISPDAWARLPEPQAIAALEAAAASAYGVPSQHQVVAAPGTQALIQWLPRLVAARDVAILGPTYGEHERVWRQAGAKVAIGDEVSSLTDADVAVVVNPNNPDGRVLPVQRLLELADTLAQHGGALVVDEAFVDVLPPGISLAPQLPRGRTIVLRSFGKAYGLAGLRLGFALAAPDFAADLRAALGPWAISGPAAEIATRALQDRAWLAATAARLATEAERLDDLLRRAGFQPIGGTPLFRLVQHAQAANWFARLGEAGILVRPFPAQPQWLRFGIPNAPEHWQRLQRALES